MTRVELHSAGDSDYDNLHRAMQAEGFRRTITAGDGTVYNLPTAEYYWETPRTLKDVLAAAQRAAEQTGKPYGIIVTEAQISTWVGLPVAAKSAPL
jgi:hypothetical protein